MHCRMLRLNHIYNREVVTFVVTIYDVTISMAAVHEDVF